MFSWFPKTVRYFSNLIVFQCFSVFLVVFFVSLKFSMAVWMILHFEPYYLGPFGAYCSWLLKQNANGLELGVDQDIMKKSMVSEKIIEEP